MTVDTRRTCAACGDSSYAVSVRIVERPDGTYAAELRCMDTIACQERQEEANHV